MATASLPPVFVVVNGPPGSGKSSLAEQLAPALGLPLISKDVIKEALMGVWKVEDVETSRRLGRAAMAVMFSIAEDASGGAVLEANFRRSLAHDELTRLPGAVMEVFCRCPREVCVARYRERAGMRPAGHLESERSDAELWDPETVNPVAGGWPVVEVETSGPVDLDGLLATLLNR